MEQCMERHRNGTGTERNARDGLPYVPQLVLTTNVTKHPTNMALLPSKRDRRTELSVKKRCHSYSVWHLHSTKRSNYKITP